MPGIEGTMKEFKHHSLHSSSGKKVTSRKQAIAIGLSEERAAHKKNNSERHARLKPDGSIMKSHSEVSGCEKGMK